MHYYISINEVPIRENHPTQEMDVIREILFDRPKHHIFNKAMIIILVQVHINYYNQKNQLPKIANLYTNPRFPLSRHKYKSRGCLTCYIEQYPDAIYGKTGDESTSRGRTNWDPTRESHRANAGSTNIYLHNLLV